MSELKKCPFCGGDAETKMYLWGHHSETQAPIWCYYTYCMSCDAMTDNVFESREEAAAAWNRRAQPEIICPLLSDAEVKQPCIEGPCPAYQPENEPLVRCGNCSHWDKSISFMGAHACAYWSPSRKEPRYTEWFGFCSFASAEPERSEG